MINLGDRVEDRITGLGGIVIARTEWLYGCVRVTIQPEESKDGKPAETFTIDEPQCLLREPGVLTPTSLGHPGAAERDPVMTGPARHGPRNDPGRAADPR